MAGKCFTSALLPSPKEGSLGRMVEAGFPEICESVVVQRPEEKWADLIRGIQRPVKSKFWSWEET